MGEKLRHLPNSITVLRMVGTVSLLFTKPMSLWFYILYTVTGITDVLDGFLARKLKLTSELGAKLDSVADLIFYGVSLSILMPVLWKTLPPELWYCVALVLFFRISAYLISAIKFRKFAATHSILNKITGACVFTIPFFLLCSFAVPACFIICFVSGVSSFADFVKYLKEKKN